MVIQDQKNFKESNYYHPLIKLSFAITYLSQVQLRSSILRATNRRSLDDFVEDLVAENSRLKAAVAEGERSVETKEYKILDLELNVNGLRETLRDIQVTRFITCQTPDLITCQTPEYTMRIYLIKLSKN